MPAPLLQPRSTQGFVGHLLRRYAISWLLVALVLGIGASVSYRGVARGERFAKAINLAGRQRMLSQRIALLCLETADPATTSLARERVAANLLETIELFETTHRALVASQAGGAEAALPVVRDARDLLETDLGPDVARYVAEARRVATLEDPPTGVALRGLTDQANALLPRLDRVVTLYETEADAAGDARRWIWVLGFGVVLAVLLSEALLVAWPALHRVRQEVGTLRLFAAIVQEADEAIVVSDPALPDNPVIYVNDQFTKMTGYALEDAAGRNCRFLQGEHTDPATVARIRKAVAERRSIREEILNYRKSGEPFWKRISIAPVFDDQGRLSHFVSVQMDVTATREAASRLEAQRARLRLFVENAPAAVAMFDREVRYMLVSKRWLRDYGLDKGVIGKTHYEVFPDIPERWKSIHRECLRGAVRSCEEDAFERADGHTEWLRWEVRPWYDDDGQVGGIIMFTEVITARKEAEEELRLTRFALESCSDAVYWISAEGAIRFVNAAASRMLGRERDDLLAATVFDVDAEMTPQRWPEVWRGLAREGSLHFESHHRRADGSRVPVEISANYLRYGTEELNCAFARDITDRKAAEAAIQRSEERLTMALEGANEGFWDWNLETGAVYYSDRWFTMLGYEPDAFPHVLETWERLVHPEDMTAAQAALEQHFAGRTERYECEFRCRNVADGWTWILARGKGLNRDDAGMPRRMVGTHADVTRRRAAEAERDRFFHLSQDLLCIASFEGTFLRLNPLWHRLVGWEEHELLATPFLEFVHPEDRDETVRQMQVLEQGGVVRDFVNRYAIRDGGYLYLSWNAASHPETGRIYAVARDMTHAMEAQRDLQRRDTLLEAASEASRHLLTNANFQEAVHMALMSLGLVAGVDRVYVFENHVDPETGALLMSQRAEWTRDSVEQQIDNPTLQDLPYLPAFRRWLERLRQGQVIEGPVRAFPKSERVVLEGQAIRSLLVAPIMSGASLWGFLGFDCCAEEREWAPFEVSILMAAGAALGGAYARQRAEEHSQQLAAIVETAHDTILGLDPEGAIQRCNQAAAASFGYAEADLIGKPVSILTAAGSRADMEAMLQQVRAGEAFRGREIQGRFRGGEELELSVTLSPMRDHAGAVVGLSLIAHDIGERKRFIAMLDEKNRQLAEYATRMESLARERARALVHADRLASIGTLSAGVAHEINNPVSFIAGNLDTLNDCWPALADALAKGRTLPEVDVGEIDFALAEMPDILKSMHDGVRRITGIVSGLKSFARQDQGERGRCDVAELVENARRLCHNRLKYHVRYEIEIPEDLAAAWGNEPQLVQVVVNLFVNAGDAMKEQGQGVLTVRAGVEGDGLWLSVADSGPGIPEHVLERMWEPFFTTKAVGEGTGLGLAISRGIIEDHGGWILVENQAGGGARFEIHLPQADRRDAFLAACSWPPRASTPGTRL